MEIFKKQNQDGLTESKVRIGVNQLYKFALKKRDPEADTTALKHEIDQLVYQLYGLTEDEIKVVECTQKSNTKGKEE